MTFLDALVREAGRRRRIERTSVWRAFQAACPVEASAGDARDLLVGQLEALATQGLITLPSRAGKAWDRSSKSAVPEFVGLSPPAASSDRPDARAIPWAPELAFLANGWTGESLEAALAIQRFLAHGGRERKMVPMRERSVQMFGAEKKLERLVHSPLFGEGRLRLATLRCFDVAPPLAFELGPKQARGRPCLVVENHHTWWSFCRWNEGVGAYSAVAYGAGSGFGREAVRFLAEQCRTWGAPHAEYFGDLDRKGLQIPWRADRQFARGMSLRIVPAKRWYRRLFERAAEVQLPRSDLIKGPDAIEWLGELGEEAATWLRSGVRLPQELVGTEELDAEGLEE